MLPLASLTGATPLKHCSSLAEQKRSRRVPQSRHQTRCERLSGSRQRMKNRPVLLLLSNLGDALFQLANGLAQYGELPHPASHHVFCRFHYGQVVGGRNGLANLADTLTNMVFTSAVMLPQEFLQLRWLDFLKVLQTGPLLDQIAH